MLNAKIFKSFDGNALTIGKNRTPLNFLKSWPSKNKALAAHLQHVGQIWLPKS